MFQGSFKDVSRKSQGCFKKVSRVFQGSFKDVSRKFPKIFKGVPRKSKLCAKVKILKYGLKTITKFLIQSLMMIG